MGSRPVRQHYCRCGTHLARGNTTRQCARCERASRDKLIAPPQVPAEFWETDQFRAAFAAQHIGRVARAYRTHPHHHTVYGTGGISQTLLGQWLGLQQPQVSRVETGPPIRDLGTLTYWAQVLRIPAELLWFRLPAETGTPTASEQQWKLPMNSSPADCDNPELDPVLNAPWNHRGTVEAVVVLSGGDRLKRRMFLSLAGPALTAPAHQWLLHEPEPVVAGLAGRRVSVGVVDRLPSMIAELRAMDDTAGGGDVLSLARYHFGWVAELLDQASYDDAVGRKLHIALAELGQLTGWVGYDTGRHGLAQRYFIAALRAAHAADDRQLGAHILGSMAYQAARQERPADAVTLIETAIAGTRGARTPRLVAELRIRQAYAFAVLNDASACTAAISAARSNVERSEGIEDPPYLYWVRPAEITTGAGDCLLQLGQTERAVALIDQGIAMFDAPFDRDRQIYLTHLADGLARPGKQRDLDAAAIKGIEAIQLAETLSSTRSVDRIRELSRQLNPHAGVANVREFLDRANGILESASR